MKIGPATLERIRALTDTSAGPNGCHPWLGLMARTKPTIHSPDLQTNVHPRRVLFEIAYGPLPPPSRVHMVCKNVRCLNVDHMAGGLAMYFHRHVDRSAGPLACWPWTGLRSKGYGRFKVGDKNRYFAHRVAWELANGPIRRDLGELVVMHTCDNPPCCNPAHLRLGTDADNQADMRAKGRHAHGPALAAAVRRAHERRRQRTLECDDQAGGSGHEE